MIMLILIIIVMFILYSLFIKKDDVLLRQCDLKENGFCIIKNLLSDSEINNLKQMSEDNNYKEIKNNLMNNNDLKNIIHEKLGDDYGFQDYIMIIKRSAVHTCHRDYNSDFYNKNQKHPSYTILIYLEDMEKCLGVIPKSHLVKNSFGVNITDNLINLLCNKGDMIIFNANLIHTGTINKKHDNLRIQLKITNKEDLDALSYYQDYNKIINKENTVPDSIRNAQLKLSCMFPFMADATHDSNIESARGSENGGKIGLFQKIFSYFFYGDSNFYDLPNAF
jgi:hypothetical protein